MIVIIIMIKNMNVEYIFLFSHNAMQIKASSDVAYDFNQVIYAVCAPLRPAMKKNIPLPSLVKTHMKKYP